MWKSCAKCGKIHEYNKKCYVGDTFRKKETQANKFRRTKEWRYKSEEIREDSNYLCSVCKDGKHPLDHRQQYNYHQLEVHHITPLEEDITRALDNYNLIALCNEHHRLAEAGKIIREYLFELAEQRENNKYK